MLADFYITSLSNDMKIAVQKNPLGGQILYRSLVPPKKNEVEAEKRHAEEPKYHTMRDTFMFYASTQGSVAIRPGDGSKPSFFLGILAKKLSQLGRTEELNSISALVVHEMSKEKAEVRIGNKMVSIPLLPTIEQSLTRLVRFRPPTVSVTEIDQCQNITVEDICVTLGSKKQPGLTNKEKKVIETRISGRKAFSVKWKTLPTETNCDWRTGSWIGNYSEDIECGNGRIYLSCYLPINNESKIIKLQMRFYKSDNPDIQPPKMEFQLSVEHDRKEIKNEIDDQQNNERGIIYYI